MKTEYIIKIVITATDETGFENSIDEVVKKLKDGYGSGQDGNDEEDYQFTVKQKQVK